MIQGFEDSNLVNVCFGGYGKLGRRIVASG